MLKVYVEYNIIAHLDEALNGRIPKDPRLGFDYSALVNLWDIFSSGQGEIDLMTCEDDCYMEFLKYTPDRIRGYSEVEKLPPHMRKKFDLFKQLKQGELLICPLGEYGYGRGPFGGGPKEHYEFLEQIRIMLDKQGLDPDKDRDARHLMHCVLYKCDHFLTMDYKIKNQYDRRYHLIQPYLLSRGYTLSVMTPSDLLRILR